MSGYIDYFDNAGKNMSFMIKNARVLIKYNEIWDMIKALLAIRPHSEFNYDDKFVRKYNS